MTELADFIGCERAHGVYYIGVPDVAIGPLYYSLYDAACVTVSADLPDAGKHLRQTNQAALTPGEVDEMVQLLMTADGPTVWSELTTHLRNGKSLTSLGDTIQIAAAELILRTTMPRNFTDGQHPFDYCNTANYWMRRTHSPYQTRVLYLMANFVNDVARSNKLFTSPIEQEWARFHLDDRTPQSLLTELDGVIMAYDVPRTTATAVAYLRSGADRQAYQATVAIAAYKFSRRSAQPQDHALHVRGVRAQLDAPAGSAPLATVPLLAGWPKVRARLLRPIHERLDQTSRLRGGFPSPELFRES
ncbi:MAG: hypothetical protein DME04_12670 [Candidatus Rokuibacteriota bacterium]|nr:MAG: hypothetical protein DME04_12670 [Candidatus Rokubacteria bacterium]